jgi:adenosylhomocysteine nucleosidase
VIVPVRIDALIITALPLERSAVRAHLRDLRTEAASGLSADLASFDGRHGSVSVALIETGAGNVSAAIQATSAVSAFRPSVSLMVGIAAGLKDVAGGDVVASSKIYFYEGGKQDEQFRPRPEFAPVSPVLAAVSRSVIADAAWQRRIIDGQADRARAFTGPIVAGEKVQADSSADVMRMIREVYGDSLALDMEDYGAVRGAAASEQVKALAIRGISDLVDDKDRLNEAVAQPVAASHAAAFAFELLDVSSAAVTRPPEDRTIAKLGTRLYPQGPQQDALWVRAGGQAARLVTAGTGQSQWWHAAGIVANGGGVDWRRLLDEMLTDYPDDLELRELSAAAAPAAGASDYV